MRKTSQMSKTSNISDQDFFLFFFFQPKLILKLKVKNGRSETAESSSSSWIVQNNKLQEEQQVRLGQVKISLILWLFCQIELRQFVTLKGLVELGQVCFWSCCCGIREGCARINYFRFSNEVKPLGQVNLDFAKVEFLQQFLLRQSELRI